MTTMFRWRYLRILWFFGWTILGVIFWDLVLPRLGLRGWAVSTRRERSRQTARNFRKLAVSMGGVMIKVGQFLSSRLDVLPREITDELAGLQDEVAPEDLDEIRKVIEAELGAPLDQKFTQFNPEPMAAASIGQVYRARLCDNGPDGTPCPSVVVKVQRPKIENIVEVDLSAIRVVGSWLKRYKPISKRANVPGLIEEFSRSLHEEIDYMNEGKNAERFAENFKDNPLVRVPHVIWSHTTRRVLTLEDVVGIKITDYDAITAAGIDRSEVANRLLDTYLKQIFEDGFFHADPHPGNLFVQPAPAGTVDGNWQLTFVDFGMTGTLSEQTFKGLREILMAVGTQDAHRMIQGYQTMNVLLPGADLELLERASTRMFERFWGASMSQMMKMHPEEAQQFVDEFGDLLYELPFQIPENLILLGRCIGILSGMCTGLNREFNVWERLAPYAGKLIDADGGGSQAKLILDEIGNVVKKLVALPGRVDSLISRMEQGRLEVRSSGLERELGRIERGQRKTATSVVFAAFLIAGVQLYLNGQMIPAAGFGGAAGLALLLILFGR